MRIDASNRVRSRIERWGVLRYIENDDEFVAEVAEGAVSDLMIGQPISVGCMLTGRCNLQCSFCYGNHEALPSNEMTADQWASSFKKLRTWGAMRVDLSGGEPMLRKDISEIANSACNCGLNVVVSTNGLLFNQDFLEQAPKCIRIHVSLDSGFAEIHEQSRRALSGSASTNSLSRSLNFISAAASHGFRIRVLTCVGRHNCDGLFALAEYIAANGVDEWNISRILPAGRALMDYESRWAIDDGPVLKQVQSIRQAFPWILIRFSNRTTQEGYFLLLLPNGDLATQFTDYRDKVRLGSLNEMSIHELRCNSNFDLSSHGKKWISAVMSSSSAI